MFARSNFVKLSKPRLPEKKTHYLNTIMKKYTSKKYKSYLFQCLYLSKLSIDPIFKSKTRCITEIK